ncbi:inactive phospholipid phosphatase 7 [Prorops nasuta]|uniref:inactive phospholipid phosphatase 7 n=1 Tax=Prorops nasuta TaxID=863751 RepID=UPI0034D010CB
MDKPEKRELPSFLKKLLVTDVYLTNELVAASEKCLSIKQLKVHYKALEISCHGIPWIAGWLALIWIMSNRDHYQMQVNMLIGLLFDIVVVAVLKALTRRRRPADNDDCFAIGPDKYSFPSGHASRTVFIVYFFYYLWPVSTIFIPSLLAWAFCVCYSRILMKRHHILDICGGIVLGIFEGLFMSCIYLDKSTCINLISWLTDEKVDGPEYDV